MFELGADVTNPAVAAKLNGFDAVVVAAGARTPRGLAAENIDAPGVVYAVDYLTASTVSVLDGGEPVVEHAAWTSWSSAAAIPVTTAWAPRYVRVRAACASLSSCRRRLMRARRATLAAVAQR